MGGGERKGYNPELKKTKETSQNNRVDLENDDKRRSKRVDNRTLESAVGELQAAHAKWKALPEAERGAFSPTWLNKNVSGLRFWLMNHGGVGFFVKLAGGEVENDFKRNDKVLGRTPESAVGELQAAHAKWKALPEAERGRFNINWLHRNAARIEYWMRENGGAQKFVILAGGDLERDFQIERITNRTLESAVGELQAAHAKWKALPETERGEFSPVWLQRNVSGLQAWFRQNGKLEHCVKLAGGEVERDFKRGNIYGRTLKSAAEELRVIHAKWKALSETERGEFTPSWLKKYDNSLFSWIKKHDGFESFIKLVGGEAEQDFGKRNMILDRTLKSAAEELRVIHAKWKALPETERGEFTPSWLIKNNPGLNFWLHKHDGVDSLVKLVGGEVEQDFKRGKIYGRTPESAVKELREAHTKWKSLNMGDNGSRPFNYKWLAENGYYNLYRWIDKRGGGIESIVELAGGEIKTDFYKSNTQTRKLRNNLDISVQELAAGQTLEAQNFRSIVNVLGASRCLDILFKFRPEFKGLPVEYVKGVLADYLGDFLVVKGEFNFRDLAVAKEFLSDATFKESLKETIKDNCLRYYFAQKREGSEKESLAIIYGYLDHIVEQTHGLKNQELDDVIQEVIIYYDQAIKDFKKPDGFVDRLSSDREFPDINQRINMKELADKKRLLIGDEMGLGKSASVIMAKEQLGVKCALVVAPSNVIGTWQKYLSDNPEGGYYKPGEAPKVLVVSSVKELENLNGNHYDYILISQERMTTEYTQALAEVDYDMMIVDEVHKLKNLEGVRTENLLPLASKIEGDDKYLALLSGTPVPNKVKDIGLLLKFLYPDKFTNVSNKHLVQQIINGDIVDLRSLLLPRMQMKTLEEGIEMPKLTEEQIEVVLSEIEKQVYEVLVEDDEVTPTEKMKIMRQFLLNPDLLDSTPNMEGSKIKKLSEELNAAFESYDNVAVYFNDYIEGVIRGENSIVNKLSLPDDVQIRVIHGGVNDKEREEIQEWFNNGQGKKLLLISGQTADVGVNYSGGQRIFFYNEPWTEYQRRQELGRVYRPGLKHDLESSTLITQETLEEGMHEYIGRKYQAIEKLLRGVPITELEKEMLKKSEDAVDPNLEVNPELARYYFSSWDKMMQIFGYVKEIGEVKFNEFLAKYGRDYARAYVDLGNRSYQANANRVVGTLIHEMIKEKGAGANAEAAEILDIASGPEMLRRHIADEHQDKITSLDINEHHFKEAKGKYKLGSVKNLPFENSSFDYANYSLAWHYTKFSPSQGNGERIEVLAEMNRVLKTGGRAVLNLMYNVELKDFEKFKTAIGALGFKVMEEYTGAVSSVDQYRSQVIVLEKVNDIKQDNGGILEEMGKENWNGFKFNKTSTSLKNSRNIAENFQLKGKNFNVEFNKDDRAVLEEERGLFKQASDLKEKYGSIIDIPKEEIISNEFVRVLTGNRYILFKKLEKGSGAMVYKG